MFLECVWFGVVRNAGAALLTRPHLPTSAMTLYQHDGDGLVDGELDVTRGGHLIGRPHTMGLLNALLRWSGCPP